jgi:fumarylacetoacetate (FAA) hydrolase family protein
LFDGHFGLDPLRRETVHLRVTGNDGYMLRGINTVASINRDLLAEGLRSGRCRP